MTDGEKPPFCPEASDAVVFVDGVPRVRMESLRKGGPSSDD